MIHGITVIKLVRVIKKGKPDQYYLIKFSDRELKELGLKKGDKLRWAVKGKEIQLRKEK